MRKVILTILIINVMGAGMYFSKSSQPTTQTHEIHLTEKVEPSVSIKANASVSASNIKPISAHLDEVQKLQNEVQGIYDRTSFDHRKMTDKEYEDSIALLKQYNHEMKQLIYEAAEGRSL